METQPQPKVARRFLFCTTTGYGHFHPLVPLARMLMQAEHHVAFAARESLGPRAEQAGFQFFAAGRDWASDPQFERYRAERQAMPSGLDLELFIYAELFCGIMPRLIVPDLISIARSWQADMIVREVSEYGSVIAAEHLGLPYATVSVMAALQGLAMFEQRAPAQLDPLRRRWGLAPDPELAALYRYLLLAFSPPSFATQDAGPPGGAVSIPATTRFIRPQFFDTSGDERLPGSIAQLPQQPTVYVTLGTEINNDPEFYPAVLESIIAGLRDAPINLIITLGRGKDPADFGPQPANVHIEPYIPQSLLLPRCDLMVMHGGSNSLLAAIDAGLPVVVVPLIADQFFNAHIVRQLQLGQIVRFEQLVPAAIGAAVDEVLGNALYRQNVARLQAEMHALPGQSHAVRLLEQIAAGTTIRE